jgi:hypothetical protein
MTARVRRAWVRYEAWIGDERRARLYAICVGFGFLLAVLLPSVWTFLFFVWIGAAMFILHSSELFQPKPSDDEVDDWF